jgi:hypothetical protein
MADKAGVLVLTGSRHTAIGAPGAEEEAGGGSGTACRGVFGFRVCLCLCANR